MSGEILNLARLAWPASPACPARPVDVWQSPRQCVVL